MSQEEVNAHLDLVFSEDKEVRMDRFNSAYYSFIGRFTLNNGEIIDNSRFNHIFIQLEPEESNENVGTYIFGFNPVFHQIKNFMFHHTFPMHLNETRVPPCDRQAYDLSVTAAASDIGDFLPPEWQ